MRLILGHGLNDYSRPSSINNKKTKEYALWHSMLTRCFCKKYQSRQPTYVKCSISRNFKNYSYFYDWCQNQIGFNQDNWQLDKDILTKGNTVYSEDACVFVPKDLNVLIQKSEALRGNTPIGVSYDENRKKYRAQIKIFGKNSFIGRFSNYEDAFLSYKNKKEEHIKTVAEIYKNQIDPRVYFALLKYTVHVSD